MPAHIVQLSVFLRFLHAPSHEQEELVRETLRPPSHRFGRYKPLRKEIARAAREARPVNIAKIVNGVEEEDRRSDLEFLANQYATWAAKQKNIAAPARAYRWQASEFIDIEMRPDLSLKSGSERITVFCVLSKNTAVSRRSVKALLAVAAQWQAKSDASYSRAAFLDLRIEPVPRRHNSPPPGDYDTARLVAQANELARLRSRLQSRPRARRSSKEKSNWSDLRG